MQTIRFLVCVQCGEVEFGRRGQTCSKRCYDRYYNLRRPVAQWDRSARACRGCGETFGPRHSTQAWCSPQCMKRARRRRDKARRRGVLHEPYTLTEIAMRDGLRCGLCGKRVAMARKVPHPRSPTVDHIVPLARGGDDVRTNVQLAHFECNWKKRDQLVTYQPMLIG